MVRTDGGDEFIYRQFDFHVVVEVADVRGPQGLLSENSRQAARDCVVVENLGRAGGLVRHARSIRACQPPRVGASAADEITPEMMEQAYAEPRASSSSS